MVLATRVQPSSISYTHCMPWYPLIYSLLPGKDQQIYTRLLTMLQRFVNNAIFHSDPRPCLRLRGSHQKRSVHSPGINIKGCLSIILNVSGETQRTQSFPASTSKAVCPLYSMYLEKRSVHSPGINIKGCLSIILNVSGETQRTQSRHQHQRLFVHYTQCIWRNAAYTVFPGINIKGCLSIMLNVSGETQRTQSRHQHQRLFVHYTQCIWRNAAYTVPASTSKAVCQLCSMYLEKRSVHSPGINIKGCLSIILNVSGETQRTQSGINIKGCLSIILNVSGETQRTQSFPASTSKAVCPLYSMYLEKRSVHSLSRHQHQRLFVHYTQCFWRNAQRHGLQIAYNKNDDIHLLVRRAAVLPLHPLNTIEDYWFNALEDIDSADTNIATLGFTDYITSYWVEENRHLWNYYATEGPRTTNHLKGWHGNSRT